MVDEIILHNGNVKRFIMSFAGIVMDQLMILTKSQNVFQKPLVYAIGDTINK